MSSIKKIVPLYAAAAKGKTPTLSMAIEVLRQVVGTYQEESYNTGRDRRACFLFDGRMIGISTGGDDDSSINDSIAFMERNKCEVVLMATRKKSDSRSWSAVWNYAQANGVDINTQVEKCYESDVERQAFVNFRQVMELLEEVILTRQLVSREKSK